MTEGVLVYRDLPVVVILLCNDGVVPDEVRPVPGDVVAWTQGRRIVDGLVAAECATTDRGLFSLRIENWNLIDRLCPRLSRATLALHLNDEPQSIDFRHTARLWVVVAAAGAQRSFNVVST